MSLKLRQLQLRADTQIGAFGADIAFGSGLVLLRADNSMGKSTCIQSIIFALGLERMLGPSVDIPLPPAMLSMIETGNGEQPVLTSTVRLEMENANGAIITVCRSAAGTQNAKLIRVYNGPHLTNPGASYESNDYFVHDPGAASRPAGFHNLLASFLGWDLPQVTKFNGQECPLYIECIFPLFLVEQKHGWSDIQGNLPTFIGIREMGKRAIEFLLKLDAYDVAQTRQRLKQAEDFTREKWSQHVSLLSHVLKQANARALNIPSSVAAGWSSSRPPRLEVSVDGDWMGIEESLAQSRTLLTSLAAQPTVSAGSVNESVKSELQQQRQILSKFDLLYNESQSLLAAENAQIFSIDKRLEALQQDLARSKDVKKLQQLGSQQALALSQGTCPTCHQHIDDTLIAGGDSVMTIDDNIAFIESQIETFQKMKLNARSVLHLKEKEASLLANRVYQTRLKIRALRETLSSESNAPSVEQVRARLLAEDAIDKNNNLLEAFRAWRHESDAIFADWNKIQEEKSRLPSDPLTNLDKDKLKALQQCFIQLTQSYGVQSVKPETLSISEETYRPMREGFNLGFDLSASDGIRVIWSYLFALLTVARSFNTNHPNILIFDEPKQQSTKRVSFATLLTEATKSRDAEQQVIFATSEPLEDLKVALDGLSYSLISVEGKILKPVPPEDSREFIENFRNLPVDDQLFILNDLITDLMGNLDGEDEVSAAIASTNATGFTLDDFQIDRDSIQVTNDTINFDVSFSYSGEQDEDSPYSGTRVMGLASISVNNDKDCSITSLSAEKDDDYLSDDPG